MQKLLQKEFQYIGMGAAKSNETSERPMNDPCLLRSFLCHNIHYTQYDNYIKYQKDYNNIQLCLAYIGHIIKLGVKQRSRHGSFIGRSLVSLLFAAPIPILEFFL